MNLVHFLTSINKISFIAFAVVFVALAYEAYSIKKENRIKHVNIPDFKANKIKSGVGVGEKIQTNQTTKKQSKLALVVIIALFIFLGIVSIVTLFIMIKTKPKANKINLQKVEYVNSEGIILFDINWNKLSVDNIIDTIEKDGEIIVGIERPSILESDIDMARIKINKDKWSPEDITTDFNKRFFVFYKKFRISSKEGELNIKAQFHSREDGWIQ